jgi:hypothetical protein
LLSALRFAQYTIQLKGDLAATDAARVKGVASSHFGTKRILKQAALFTVMQVKIFEDAVHSAPEPTDRIIAGFACSLIHGRGRFSDMQFARNIIDDYDSDGVGYLEFQCGSTKTSKSDESKRMFMPHICPTQGVHSKPWAPVWMRARKEQGLSLAANACVMPHLDCAGNWTSMPVSSSTI